MILQAGEITSPAKNELFYLSQRPYLVVGSLRDQLLYPVPPARVWQGSMLSDKQLFTSIAGEEPKYGDVDDGKFVGAQSTGEPLQLRVSRWYITVHCCGMFM